MEGARAEILSLAAGAMARRGFHGMSLRELARASGHSPAWFYNHFDSKEALLHELQMGAFNDLLETAAAAVADAGPDPKEQLHRFVLGHVRYCARHPDLLRVLVTDAGALAASSRSAIWRLKERYFDMGHDLVATLAPPDMDPAEVERRTWALFGMLNWVWAWYDESAHGGPEAIARTMTGLMLGEAAS